MASGDGRRVGVEVTNCETALQRDDQENESSFLRTKIAAALAEWQTRGQQPRPMRLMQFQTVTKERRETESEMRKRERDYNDILWIRATAKGLQR